MSDSPTERAAERPATYGGPGWQARDTDLAAEIAQGRLWHPCGSGNEWGKLAEVVISQPGEELLFAGPADRYLMLARPDLPRLRAQTAALVQFYQGQGVKVHLAQAASPPPPNFLFMRDLFWATRQGVILARPAARQRAGEERHAALALAKIGVPIIFQPRGTATFEGADALWRDERTVLLGTGLRTNREGFRQISGLLADMGIRVHEVKLPTGTQHLLGVVNFVDHDLAVIHGGRVSQGLLGLLADLGVGTVILPTGHELEVGLAMNFVTLGPRRILMPSACPGIETILRAAGLEVFTIEIGEYLKAAGGLACLTGILRRE